MARGGGVEQTSKESGEKQVFSTIKHLRENI